MGGSAGKLYKAMKNPGDDKALRESFSKYDVDKNGTLDRQELHKFGLDCLAFLMKDVKQEHFFVRITVKGMQRMMNKEEFIEWCISEADVNGDGTVSYEEFGRFVASHPSWENFKIENTLGRDIKDSVNGALVSAFTGDNSQLEAVEERRLREAEEEKQAHDKRAVEAAMYQTPGVNAFPH